MKYTEFEKYLAQKHKMSLPAAFIYDQLYKKPRKGQKDRFSSRLYLLSNRDLDIAEKQLLKRKLMRIKK